jgi:hypothetical protein
MKQAPTRPFLIFQPQEHLSSAAPLPPRSHSEQSTINLPLLSYPLCLAFAMEPFPSRLSRRGYTDFAAAPPG